MRGCRQVLEDGRSIDDVVTTEIDKSSNDPPDFARRRDAGRLVFMSSVADRAYSGEADFLAIRQFLVDSYAAFGEMFNWGHERWEIVRFSGNAACELADDRSWKRFVRIWESDGRIVGVAHPESGGDTVRESVLKKRGWNRIGLDGHMRRLGPSN